MQCPSFEVADIDRFFIAAKVTPVELKKILDEDKHRQVRFYEFLHFVFVDIVSILWSGPLLFPFWQLAFNPVISGCRGDSCVPIQVHRVLGTMYIIYGTFPANCCCKTFFANGAGGLKPSQTLTQLSKGKAAYSILF